MLYNLKLYNSITKNMKKILIAGEGGPGAPKHEV